MNNIHKSITHNINTQKEDDIMSTIEYVESLKQKRFNLLRVLGNLTMSHDDYEHATK